MTNLVKKRKLSWFGNVSRSSGLAKTILQSTVKGKKEADRRRGGKTLPAQLGQLKTELGGKELWPIYLRCPDVIPRLWARI